LTNKSNLIGRLLIRYFDNLVVAYFLRATLYKATHIWSYSCIQAWLHRSDSVWCRHQSCLSLCSVWWHHRCYRQVRHSRHEKSLFANLRQLFFFRFHHYSFCDYVQLNSCGCWI